MLPSTIYCIPITPLFPPHCVFTVTATVMTGLLFHLSYFVYIVFVVHVPMYTTVVPFTTRLHSHFSFQYFWFYHYHVSFLYICFAFVFKSRPYAWLHTLITQCLNSNKSAARCGILNVISFSYIDDW